jgi:hypothetical protein
MSLGSAAWAYNMSLPDQTLVQGWIDHNTAAAYGYYGYDPVDTIPPNDVHWDLKRVDLTWTPSNTLLMQIYTNYPQAGLDGAGQTDIAFDTNRDGVFETGVIMRSGDANFKKVVSGVAWKTSEDIWGVYNNYIYSGRFYNDQGQLQTPPPNVQVNGFTQTLGAAAVNWNSGGAVAAYRIDVEFPLSYLGAGWNKFDFTVGNGSCANDFMYVKNFQGHETPVPTPATFLLLGSGIIALWLLKGRRQPALAGAKAKA